MSVCIATSGRSLGTRQHVIMWEFDSHVIFVDSAVTGEKIAKSAEFQGLQSKWQVCSSLCYTSLQ